MRAPVLPRTRVGIVLVAAPSELNATTARPASDDFSKNSRLEYRFAMITSQGDSFLRFSTRNGAQ